MNRVKLFVFFKSFSRNLTMTKSKARETFSSGWIERKRETDGSWLNSANLLSTGHAECNWTGLAVSVPQLASHRSLLPHPLLRLPKSFSTQRRLLLARVRSKLHHLLSQQECNFPFRSTAINASITHQMACKVSQEFALSPSCSPNSMRPHQLPHSSVWWESELYFSMQLNKLPL